jgi:hypothetical protein
MTQLFSLYVNPNRSRDSLTIPPTPDTSMASALETCVSPLVDEPTLPPVTIEEPIKPKPTGSPVGLAEVEISYFIEGLGLHQYFGNIDRNGQVR